MLDAEGYIVNWNPEGAEHIKGYRRERIVGQHFSDPSIVTDDDRSVERSREIAGLAAAAADRKVRGPRAGGFAKMAAASGRAFLSSIAYQRGKDGRTCRFCEGHTRPYRAAEQRRKGASPTSAEDGRHRHSFTGGRCHDFNNLLTIIIGNLETICSVIFRAALHWTLRASCDPPMVR